MIDIWKAIVLGVIEGLTEFIPVSSTGHLILTSKLLQFNSALDGTFEIFIQLGAILAVVALYPRRFTGLIPQKLQPEESEFTGTSGLLKLFLACIPAFILGFLFHSTIKEWLFHPLPVAAALIAGGVIMVLIERREKNPDFNTVESLPYRTCFLIGVFQCLALWPGMSRSAATIIGGMILGLHRKVAAEFSFLVAVPVMTAAVGYDFLKSYSALDQEHLFLLGIGFFVSFGTAIVAVKFFITLLQRMTLAPFGYYRIILGILVILATMISQSY